MAGYTRQSTFADGDTITAALFNNEYNQLLNAFSNTGGHKHDGTAAEGPVIGLIGDAGETSPNNKVLIDTTNNYIEFYVEVSSNPVQQLYIADGAIIPVTDSDVDLGTSSLYFKNAYIDSITTTGNVAVGGNLTVTGTTTFNGGTITMGDAATDNVVFGADVDSNIIPDDDDSYDLGSSSQQWKDIYIDGVAYVDAINFNGTAITSTAAELNILDGVTSTAAELNILDGVTSTAAEINLLDGVTSTTAELNILDGVTSTAVEINLLDGVTSTTAELNILDGVTASAADINLIDGITNGTVIASKAIITDANKDITGGRNITITGELDAATLDISGNADIDGTLETDALSINGTTVTSTAAELNILDGVTATAAEINALDGITSTVAELNILDGVTSTAAELNLLDGKAFLDEDDMSSNSATGIASQQSIKAYVDTQITAEDLDITTDSGTIAIDLDSETLTVSGGTGLDSSATGNAVTLAIDSTVATLTGSQTLTNKSLTAPTLTGTAVVASLDISGDIDVDGTTNLDVVDIDGAVDMASTLNVSGAITGTLATAAQPNITSLGTLTALTGGTGDLNWDSGTLFVDSSANAVGIGTTSPSANLHVSSSGDTIARITSADGNTALLDLGDVSDPDGGRIFYDSGSNLGFTTASTERMRIDSSGNVGIGTNSPSHLLDVRSTTSPVLNIQGGDGNSKNIYFRKNTGDTVEGRIKVYDNVMSFETAGSEALRIDSNQNVGIGTTSPSAKLDVNGTANVNLLKVSSYETELDSGHLRFKFNGGSYIDQNTVGQPLGFRVSGSSSLDTTAMTLDSSGRLGIGTSSPSRRLHLYHPANDSNFLQFTNTTTGETGSNGFLVGIGGAGNAELWNYEAQPIIFGTSSSERMRIDSSGNLLVGATSFNAGAFGSAKGINVSATQPLILVHESDTDKDGFMGISNSVMFLGTADAIPLRFSTNDAERMRIDSSGNVGIGVTNPDSYDSRAEKLVVGETGDAGITIASGASSDCRLVFAVTNQTDLSNGSITYDQSADSMAFETAGSERMRIDSSGNVGIGTSSPNAPLTIQTESGTGSKAGLRLNNPFGFDDLNTGAEIIFSQDRSSSEDFKMAAIVSGQGSAGSSNEGYLKFFTRNGGTIAEKVRIDNSGKVGIGTTAPEELLHVSTGSTVGIRASGGGNSARKIEIGYDNTNGPYVKGGSSGVTSIQFYVDNTTLAGKFDTNADFYTNDGTVHSLSDSRVKTDINDLIDGLDIVKQLQPKTFKYNEKSEFYSEKTKDEVRYGFIADEVKEVAPQYMQVGKGKIDGVEVDDLKTLSTTKMIPMLVKAIQEQQTQIDALQSEINNLKGE